jgi:branched-chain amino acid transport system ATP-binding protein
VLELRDVSVAYGQALVVNGVDLNLAENEVVGLVGKNGAGKTSLLHTICGLTTPAQGEVLLDGQRLNGRRPEEIAALGIRLVPEGRQIFKTLTVAENIRVGACGEPEEIKKVLAHFPVLEQRAEQQADRLSGGEQQMLALARALVGKPRLLLIDEPSLGLAPKMIDTVYGLLADFRRQGMAMLLVEQSRARASDFCDRYLNLEDGRLSTDRGVDQVSPAHGLAVSAHLGPPKEHRKEANVS